MGNSVLQDWVTNLSFKEQTGLISSIRGCDYIDKYTDLVIDNEDKRYSHKDVVKLLRYSILKNADKKTDFMSKELIPARKIVLLLGILHVNKELLHWYEHVVLAIKIIAKNHDNIFVKDYWGNVLKEIK